MFNGAGQAENALFTHFHRPANPHRLAFNPLDVLRFADHQPAGRPFNRFRAAVDNQVGAHAVVALQIFFRRRIDDQRQVMLARHFRGLRDVEHAFLHAVVGFDVQNRRGARSDRRRQLLGRAFIGVARFHQLTAAQRHHRANRRAEVDVVALRQHDFVIFNRGNVQVLQQPVAVFHQHRRYRLGNPRRCAGDNGRPFHIQQFGDVLAGFIHQVFHFKVLVHTGHRGFNHFRARRGNAQRRHAARSINHLF